MRKFRVMINGRNFVIDPSGKKMGFYANRYVEAEGEIKAEYAAVDLIRQELRPYVKNDRTDVPMMYLKKIDELEDFEDALIPGKGCIWYSENEKDAEKAGQWWVSALIGGIVIAGLAGFLVINHKRKRNQYEEG